MSVLQNRFVVCDIFGSIIARFVLVDNALDYAKKQSECVPGKLYYVAKMEPIYTVEGARRTEVNVTAVLP